MHLCIRLYYVLAADATSATELLQELLRQQPTAEGMALMTPCSVELEQQLDELRKEAERLVDEGNIAEFDKVSKVGLMRP